MTEKEIRKAIHCCYDHLNVECGICPLKDDDCCMKTLGESILHLITQKNVKIERLEAQIAVLQGWGVRKE